MSEFHIIGIRTGGVHVGDASNNNADSPFIRPSEIGAKRFLRCDFDVKVAVANDLSTFVSINGGNIHEDHLPNDGTNYGWPKAFLAASFEYLQFRAVLGTNNQFALYTPSYGEVIYNFDNSSQWSQGWSTGNTTIFYSNFGIGCPPSGGAAISRIGWYDKNADPSGYGTTFPLASQSIEADGFSFEGTKDQFISHMANLGYSYVGLLGNSSWGEGETSRSGYVYIGGLCLFNESTAEDTAYWTQAAKVEISGLRDFIDYYPWERSENSVWTSLNDHGGPSEQQSYGLFRYNSGWQPISNTEADDASKQHGFRHNGTSWVKSPKSGQGA